MSTSGSGSRNVRLSVSQSGICGGSRSGSASVILSAS